MKNYIFSAARKAKAVALIGAGLSVFSVAHAELIVGNVPGRYVSAGGETFGSTRPNIWNEEIDGEYAIGDLTLKSEADDLRFANFNVRTVYHSESQDGLFYTDNDKTMLTVASPSFGLPGTSVINGSFTAGLHNALFFTLRNASEVPAYFRDSSVVINFMTNAGNTYSHTIQNPGANRYGPSSNAYGELSDHRFTLSGNEYFSGFSITPSANFGVAIGSIGYGTADYGLANPVPEPETYALMALGLVGIAVVKRRKAKSAKA